MTLSGREQVFVAPGDEDEPLKQTDLPWAFGHMLAFPLEHWDVILAEAKLVDARLGGMLEKASGVADPDAGTEVAFTAGELA